MEHTFCRKCAPKTSPRLHFNLLNSPKQPVLARNPFENKIYRKTKHA